MPWNFGDKVPRPDFEETFDTWITKTDRNSQAIERLERQIQEISDVLEDQSEMIGKVHELFSYGPRLLEENHFRFSNEEPLLSVEEPSEETEETEKPSEEKEETEEKTSEETEETVEKTSEETKETVEKPFEDTEHFDGSESVEKEDEEINSEEDVETEREDHL